MVNLMQREAKDVDIEDSLALGRRWWIVPALLLLAFTLRSWDLHKTGLTPDEVAEVLKARASIESILRDQDEDRFPPLYRLVLAVSIRASGSDLAARWLSVLAGVAAVLVAWRAGAQLLGERHGLWAAFFLAICPFHIHYCREGRAYALFFLFCALAIWAMLRLLQSSSWKNWLLLVLGSLLSLYTHYYAVPLLMTLWAVVLAAAYRHATWLRGVVALLMMVILALPAAWLLRSALLNLPPGSVGKLVAEFDLEACGYNYMALVSGFALGPSMRELRGMPAAEGIRLFLPWILLVGLSLSLLSWQAYCRLRQRSEFLSLLILLFALVPLIGVTGNLAGVGYVYRYAIWLVLPYVLWIAAGAANARKHSAAWFGGAALVLLNGVALTNMYSNSRYQQEDLRAMSEYLEARPRRPILVASPYIAQALNYYLPGDWQASSFPIFAELEKEKERQVALFLEGLPAAESYWLVSEWLPVDDVRRNGRDSVLKHLGPEFVEEVGFMEVYTGVR